MDKLLTSILVALVMMQCYCATSQTTHVVGDASGWVVPQTPDTYSNWASTKSFAVLDILTFNFRTGEHDVLQVPKASYDACTADNPIGNMITTGPANITLTSAGDVYFICTVGRHCQAGQKLAISVSGTPVPAPPTIPSPPVTPEACPPTDSPSPSPTGSSTRPELMPPPPPSPSSSTAVFAGVLLPMLAVAVAFF